MEADHASRAPPDSSFAKLQMIVPGLSENSPIKISKAAQLMKAADHIHLLKTENDSLQVRTANDGWLFIKTVSNIRMRLNFWKSPMRISLRILYLAKANCLHKEMVKVYNICRHLLNTSMYLRWDRFTEWCESFFWPWAFFQRSCSSLFNAKLEVLDLLPINGASVEVFWKVSCFFLSISSSFFIYENFHLRSVLNTSNEDLMRTSCSWLDQHVNLVNLRPLVTQMLKVNIDSIFRINKTVNIAEI